MKYLDMYTDGSCLSNPGNGGWSVVVANPSGEVVEVLSGSEQLTTNNRMEMTAVLNALYHAWSNSGVYNVFRVFSDSAYTLNTINRKWYAGWKQNGWKTKSGDPVKNVDLWEAIAEAMEQLKRDRVEVHLIKVKGHSGDPLNEMADKYAKEEASNCVEDYTSTC